MDTYQFTRSMMLMLVLFNPFLMSVYLLDLIKGLDLRVFTFVLLRAFLISGIVFLLFVIGGDALFYQGLQARLESFLIFGGIIFLIIGIRYIVFGIQVIPDLKGPPQHLAAAVAMPFMIGPGTISASILIGRRLSFPYAVLAIATALVISCLLLIAFKIIHDKVKTRNEQLVERYVEMTGRISALIIGTLAIDMILTGLERWLSSWEG